MSSNTLKLNLKNVSQNLDRSTLKTEYAKFKRDTDSFSRDIKYTKKEPALKWTPSDTNRLEHEVNRNSSTDIYIKPNTGSHSNQKFEEGGTTVGGMDNNTNYKFVKQAVDTEKKYHIGLMTKLSKNNVELINNLNKSHSVLEKISNFQISVQSNFYKQSLALNTKVVDKLQDIYAALLVGFNIDPKTGEKDSNQSSYNNDKELSILQRLFFKDGMSGFKSGIGDLKKFAGQKISRNIKNKIPGGELIDTLLSFSGSITPDMYPALISGAITDFIKGSGKDMLRKHTGGKYNTLIDTILNPEGTLRNYAASKNKFGNSVLGNILNGIGVNPKLLAEAFGVNIDKERIGSLRSYKELSLEHDKRERATFDGNAYKALVTVIPDLLSKQIQILSGSKEQYHYSYEKGTYLSTSEIQKNREKAVNSESFLRARKNIRDQFDTQRVTGANGKVIHRGGIIDRFIKKAKQMLTKNSNDYVKDLISMLEKNNKLYFQMNEIIKQFMIELRLVDANKASSDDVNIELFDSIMYNRFEDRDVFINYISQIVRNESSILNMNTASIEILAHRVYSLFAYIAANDDNEEFFRSNYNVVRNNLTDSAIKSQKEISTKFRTLDTMISTSKNTLNGLGGSGGSKGSFSFTSEYDTGNTRSYSYGGERGSSEELAGWLANNGTLKDHRSDKEYDNEVGFAATDNNGNEYRIVPVREGDQIVFKKFIPKGSGKDRYYVEDTSSKNISNDEVKNIFDSNKGINADLKQKFEEYTNSQYVKSSDNFIDEDFTTDGIIGNISESEKTKIILRKLDAYVTSELGAWNNVLYKAVTQSVNKLENETGKSKYDIISSAKDTVIKYTKEIINSIAGIGVVNKFTTGIKKSLDDQISDILDNFKENGRFNQKTLLNRYNNDEEFRKTVDSRYIDTDYGNTAESYGNFSNQVQRAIKDKGFVDGIISLANDSTRGKGNKKLISIAASMASNMAGLAAGDGMAMFGIKSIIQQKVLGNTLGISKLLEAYDDESEENKKKTKEQRELEKYEAKEEVLLRQMTNNLGSGTGAMVHQWMKKNVRFGGVMGMISNIMISSAISKLGHPLLKMGKGALSWVSRKATGFVSSKLTGERTEWDITDPLGRKAKLKEDAERANKEQELLKDQEANASPEEKEKYQLVSETQKTNETLENISETLNESLVQQTVTTQKLLGGIYVNTDAEDHIEESKGLANMIADPKIKSIVEKHNRKFKIGVSDTNDKEDKQDKNLEDTDKDDKSSDKDKDKDSSSGGILSKILDKIPGVPTIKKIFNGFTSSIGSILKGLAIGAGASYLTGKFANFVGKKMGVDEDKMDALDNKINTTGNNVKRAGKGIFRRTLHSVAKGIGETAAEGKNAAVTIQKLKLGDKVLKPLLNIMKKFGGWLGKKLPVSDDIWTKIAVKTDDFFKWAFKESIEKTAKKTSNGAIKKLLQKANSLLGLASPIGTAISLAVSAGFGIYGAISGWRNAYTYFGFESNSDCTFGMKLASAVVSAICEIIPSLPAVTFLVGVVLDTIIAYMKESFIKWIYNLFSANNVEEMASDKEAKNIKKQRADLESYSQFGFDMNSSLTPDIKTTPSTPSNTSTNTSSNTSNDVYGLGGSGVGSMSQITPSSAISQMGVREDSNGKPLPLFISQLDFDGIILGGTSAVFNGCALACAKMISDYYNKEISDHTLISSSVKYLLKDKSISTDYFAAIKGKKVKVTQWLSEIKVMDEAMFVLLVNLNKSNHFVTVYKSGNSYYLGDPLSKDWQKVELDFLSKLKVAHVRSFDNTKGIDREPSKEMLGGAGFWSSVKNFFTGGAPVSTDTSSESEAAGTTEGSKGFTTAAMASTSGPTKVFGAEGKAELSSGISSLRSHYESIKYGKIGSNGTSTKSLDPYGMGKAAGDGLANGGLGGDVAGGGNWLAIANNEANKNIAVHMTESSWDMNDANVVQVMKYMAVAASGNKDADPSKGMKANWCAGFVSYCLIQAGVDMSKTISSGRSLSSQFAVDNDEFIRLNEPKVGAIVVWKQRSTPSSDSISGHVAFVTGGSGGTFDYLGGNQGIGKEPYRGISSKKGASVQGNSRQAVAGFFWPKNVPMGSQGDLSTGGTTSSGNGVSIGSGKYNFRNVKTGTKFIDTHPEIADRLSAAFAAADEAKKQGLSHADPYLVTAMSVQEHGWKAEGAGGKLAASNNPGNIRVGSNWKGPTVSMKSGKYRKYDSLKDGFLAMYKLMSKSEYYKKYRSTGNILDLLEVWAPRHENDTSGYHKFVSDKVNEMSKITPQIIAQAGGTTYGGLTVGNEQESKKKAKEVFNKLIKAFPKEKNVICGIYALGAIIVNAGIISIDQFIDLVKTLGDQAISANGTPSSLFKSIFIFSERDKLETLDNVVPNISSGKTPHNNPDFVYIVSCTKKGRSHYIGIQSLPDGKPLIYDSLGKPNPVYTKLIPKNFGAFDKTYVTTISSIKDRVNSLLGLSGSNINDDTELDNTIDGGQILHSTLSGVVDGISNALGDLTGSSVPGSIGSIVKGISGMLTGNNIVSSKPSMYADNKLPDVKDVISSNVYETGESIYNAAKNIFGGGEQGKINGLSDTGSNNIVKALSGIHEVLTQSTDISTKMAQQSQSLLTSMRDSLFGIQESSESYVDGLNKLTASNTINNTNNSIEYKSGEVNDIYPRMKKKAETWIESPVK